MTQNIEKEAQLLQCTRARAAERRKYDILVIKVIEAQTVQTDEHKELVIETDSSSIVTLFEPCQKTFYEA
jgi:hypothetical protein